MFNNLSGLKRYLVIAAGSIIFCAGLNLFIVPVDLYNGGVVGVAQILRTIMVQTLHLPIPSNVDVSGIINFLINVPLLYLAYRQLGRKFFCRTIFSVIVMTIFMSVILIPEKPIMADRLSACLIGGMITGVGVGLILRAGASGGGIDILGVYLTLKRKDFSVGKMNLIFNAMVYVVCAVLFDLNTALYSVMVSGVFSLVVDRIHYQNINMSVMIFTKETNLHEKILFELHRGVTYWYGVGAYTGEYTHILVTIISKYEINHLKRAVLDVDPNAFIILNEGLQVLGNYEKRL